MCVRGSNTASPAVSCHSAVDSLPSHSSRQIPPSLPSALSHKRSIIPAIPEIMAISTLDANIAISTRTNKAKLLAFQTRAPLSQRGEQNAAVATHGTGNMTVSWRANNTGDTSGAGWKKQPSSLQNTPLPGITNALKPSLRS